MYPNEVVVVVVCDLDLTIDLIVIVCKVILNNRENKKQKEIWNKTYRIKCSSSLRWLWLSNSSLVNNSIAASRLSR